jgi:hypothetical protein
MASLCIASIACLVSLYSQEIELSRARYLVVASGLFWGLAMSAKWTALILVVSVILSVSSVDCGSWIRRINLCLLTIASAVLAFFLTNPLILFNIKGFLKQFASLLEDSRQGWYGHTTTNAWLFHLTQSFASGYGIPLLFFATAGLIAIVRSQKFPIGLKVALLAFPIVFFAMIGRSSMGFQRYILPVFPFLAIYSGIGMQSIARYFSKQWKWPKTPVITFFFALSVIANIYGSFNHNWVLHQMDTRQQFTNLLSNFSSHLDRPLKVYSGGYLAYGSYNPLQQSGLAVQKLYTAPAGRKATQLTNTYERARLAGDKIDLLMFDSFSHDPLLYSDRDFLIKHPYPNLHELYALSLSPFTISKDRVPFSPESTYSPVHPDLKFRSNPGPFIEIYARDRRLIEQLKAKCDEFKYRCEVHLGDEAYYLRKINEKLHSK